MIVHVGEPRHQVLAGAIHHLAVFWDSELAARAYGPDPAVTDQDRPVWLRGRGDAIDDGDVRERDWSALAVRGYRDGQNQDEFDSHVCLSIYRMPAFMRLNSRVGFTEDLTFPSRS